MQSVLGVKDVLMQSVLGVDDAPVQSVLGVEGAPVQSVLRVKGYTRCLLEISLTLSLSLKPPSRKLWHENLQATHLSDKSLNMN